MNTKTPDAASKAKALIEASRKNSENTPDATPEVTGDEQEASRETRISARTAAEQSRGQQVLEGHADRRARAKKAQALADAKERKGRTVISDVDDDEADVLAKLAEAEKENK